MKLGSKARVAMVGGGQLARMTYEAALPLGITLTVLDAHPLAPAIRAGAQVVVGDPCHLASLAELALMGEVVTFDHERVPIENVRRLEDAGVTFAPGSDVAELAFDKAASRRRLRAAGFPVPDAVSGSNVADVVAFAGRNGWPVVVKAAVGGYDGRAVEVVANEGQAAEAAARLGPRMVIESFVAFDSEIAVLVARSASGEVACYDPVSTVQSNGICVEVHAPAAIPGHVRSAAMDLARSLASTFGLVGVMAVELFLVGDDLIINELATRPHNSAHHTIEAAETSQFEQHLRAVLGWPLGPTDLRAPAAVTCNVLGAEDGSNPLGRLRQALGVPGAHVHLYAKTATPGRKLGHVTACGKTIEEAGSIARRAAMILSSPTPEYAGVAEGPGPT